VTGLYKNEVESTVMVGRLEKQINARMLGGGKQRLKRVGIAETPLSRIAVDRDKTIKIIVDYFWCQPHQGTDQDLCSARL
jgi:hypothetical protein